MAYARSLFALIAVERYYRLQHYEYHVVYEYSRTSTTYVRL
jgi:hypothetical protein